MSKMLFSRDRHDLRLLEVTLYYRLIADEPVGIST